MKYNDIALLHLKKSLETSKFIIVNFLNGIGNKDVDYLPGRIVKVFQN